MSWLSKAVKGVGKALGGLAKVAAPIVSVIPGIGPIGGAAIGGLGSLLSGGNVGDHLRAATGGALGGLGAMPGIGGAVSTALGGLRPTPTFSGQPVIPPSVGQGVATTPQGSANGVMDFLGGNGGRNMLGLLSGGLAAYRGYQQNQLQRQSLKDAERQAAELDPIRQQALRDLSNPSTPDLSGLRATRNTGNPYAN